VFAAVYALLDIEMASATLVLSEVVWAVVHEEYVTARFWMRPEKLGSSRLEMCSLNVVSWDCLCALVEGPTQRPCSGRE
jgi:hypothetical protein